MSDSGENTANLCVLLFYPFIFSDYYCIKYIFNVGEENRKKKVAGL